MTRARRNPDGTIQEVGDPFIQGASGKQRVALRFALVDDRIECVRVEIGARFDNPREPSPRPLRATDLRIALAELVEHAKRQRVANLERILRDEGLPAAVRRRRPAARRALSRAKKSVGRPRLPHELLEDVARVYLAALESGDYATQPTKAVADHFHVARSTANKWVARARAPEVGLLPPTSQGKASAAPRRGGRRASHGSK